MHLIHYVINMFIKKSKNNNLKKKKELEKERENSRKKNIKNKIKSFGLGALNL